MISWAAVREALRAVGQAFGYSLRTRRLSLWLFLVLGVIAVALTAATSTAAPVLIYPVL